MEKKKLSKGKKIAVIIFTILLVIGLTLLIIGIAIPKPSMSDPNWFDTDSKRTGFIMFGGFLSVVSLMFGIPIIFASDVNEKIKTLSEKQEFSDQYFENSINVQPKQQYCEYCGTALDNNKVCSSCGAKVKKKN